MNHYTYILKSSKHNNRYVGTTTDLKRRLHEHNSGLVRYTRSGMPWKLIWYCTFFEKRHAYDFERYLKSSSGHAFTNKRLI